MSEIVHQASIELDASVIGNVINAAVITSTEVVNFHFKALEGADLSIPATPAGGNFRITTAPIAAPQRRLMHENWLLARAFQDLLRAVRHGLELAYVLTSVLSKAYRAKSDTTLAEFLRPFEVRAATLRFPQLLEQVNERLATEIDFASSYRSLQSARNCLEHRAGVVGTPETQGGVAFELSVPRVKLFYMNGTQEVEVGPGVIVAPDDNRDEVDILMRIEPRRRQVNLGERLVFSLQEFNDIAFACHYLGAQLVAKLPKPPIAP